MRLINYLSRESVVHGVDTDAIAALLSEPVFDTPIVIARATPAIHGTPPEPEFEFDTDVGRPYLSDESGRVDLRELNFIQEKHKGDLLVRIQPAVEAVDGVDVHGRKIEAAKAAKGAAIKPGNNTKTSRNGADIRALTDGNVCLQSGTVSVEPIVVVDSVDYRTGNLDYEGSIQIKRGIADGFTVRAGGTLEVGECVGRVTLLAEQEILLKGGINGGKEGVVDAGSNIFAKYIEGARVACRGNLFVTEAIMHSSVSVHGNVGLRGKHAELIGGSALIGGNLWCKKIGSVSETMTRVAVGVDPERLVAYAAEHAHAEKLRDHIDDLD